MPKTEKTGIRYLKILPSLGLLLASLCGCGAAQTAQQPQAVQSAAPDAKPCSSAFFAMDTMMELTVYGDEALLRQAENRVLQLESRLSTTDEGSEIYAINRDGRAEVSEETAQLLNKTLALCKKVGGALDISIYPIVREWGFTTGEYHIPDADTIRQRLQEVDYRKITVDGKAVRVEEGMEIDLGSVAKGYTGDVLAGLLQEAGVTSAMINLGGNVQTVGSKPDGSGWKVGVQNPLGGAYMGVLELSDKAVITSGGYERYFEGEDGNVYWHIMDPATGAPARSGVISATIVTDSGLYGDSLSTSLFVMGLDKAVEFWRANRDFEAVLVTQDGDIYITEGLQNCFSLTGDNKGRALTVIKG